MNADQKFQEIEAKMLAGNVRPAAIRAFKRSFEQLLAGGSGEISENEIAPAEGIANAVELKKQDDFDPELLAQTVVIKLNGGLGTSMGLEKVKSLLEVKPGLNFLDIIAKQTLHLRQSTGANVRCLLMNSWTTSDDTCEALEKYRGEGLGDPKGLELMQNRVPKLEVDSLQPVTWAENPGQEWCPPGHGDLYAALLGSGALDELLAAGVKYAFVSNSDNLGAVLDPALLSYFAGSDVPFLMEVTERTLADRKGGHLAVRKSDEQLLLREVAQCPAEDLEEFQNIDKHRYFNTNNLWVRLDVLKQRLDESGGALPLPVIRNQKPVDPRDSSTPAVYQLETAMGAAIESFVGASAINVPRSRFAPVKTTADLLALRSDAYVLTEDSRIILAPSREGKAVVVKLSDDYRLVDSLQGMAIPSLLEADSLTLEGPVDFEAGVTIRGAVTFSSNADQALPVKAGVYEK